MGRRENLKAVLIEDVHIALKRENQARAINKAQSETLIVPEQRIVNRLQRDTNKMRFDTYQEMSTFFSSQEVEEGVEQ